MFQVVTKQMKENTNYRGYYMGVFGDFAMKYYEAGYSVIPLIEADKRPAIDEWSKYCEQMPTNEEIERWESEFPNANIGFCLGKASNICAVDFDMTFGPCEEIENFLLGYLPPTPLVKKGKKGWTRFYKYNDEPAKKFNKKSGDTQQRMIDFLSHGNQTVAPPSIHPETKQPYVWLFEDAVNINVVDLPSLPTGFFDICNTLSSDDHKNILSMKEGRHDKIVAYGFAIIEKQKSIEEFAEKLIEYDKRINKECQYFIDRKYFKKSQSDNALEVARKVEKSVSKIFEKSRNIVGWRIGEEVKIADIDMAIKYSPGFYEVQYDEKNEKLKYIPDYNGLGNVMKQNGVYRSTDGCDYVFRNGHWQYIGEKEKFNLILQLNKMQSVPSHYKNFITELETRCHTVGFGPSPGGFVNVANGILCIKTGELVPHSHKFEFRYKTDVSYDPNSKCDLWIKTLKQIMVLDADRIKTIQQMFGYILLGGRPFLEKSFALMGDGRNGKSVVLGVLKEILGNDNFSSVSLSAFSEKFETVMLDGKICNISTDEGNDFKVNAGAFKRAVSGEELIVQQKGSPAYKIKNTARFVFACNEMPFFGDRSHAMMDRIILINFDRFFLDEDKNTSLIDELKCELSGILNWSLEGAREVLATKSIFQSKMTIEEKQDFFEESDPIKVWFNDSIEITEPSDFVKTSELYDHYRSALREDGHTQILSKIGFSRALRKIIRKFFAEKSKGIPPSELKLPHNDGKTRIVRGIRWLDGKREIKRLFGI